MTVKVTEKWHCRKIVTEKLHKVTISAPVVDGFSMIGKSIIDVSLILGQLAK